MRVLGIDPGTLHLGWGVVEMSGNRFRHIAHGVVDLNSKASLPERLVKIERQLIGIIAAHSPAAASVESLFFHRDAQAASKLGHARGVILLSLARAGLAVFEYPPARVKNTVTGHGQAGKGQVAFMIRALLALDEEPRADAADALAVAVTHLRRAPVQEALASARDRALSTRGAAPEKWTSPRGASARVRARVLALAGSK